MRYLGALSEVAAREGEAQSPSTTPGGQLAPRGPGRAQGAESEPVSCWWLAIGRCAGIYVQDGNGTGLSPPIPPVRVLTCPSTRLLTTGGQSPSHL